MTHQKLLVYMQLHPEDIEALHKYMDSLEVVQTRIAVSTDEEVEAQILK
nr:hypothetical protein [Nostoc sp. MG11]